MGFWSTVCDVVGAAAAPVTFGASLLISPTARDTVKEIIGAVSGGGREPTSKNDSDTNHVSKEQNRVNELITKNQEDLLKKLQDLETRTGIAQPISKIQESQKLTKEEITKLIEEARSASPERRQEIIDEVAEKVRKEQEEANRILKEARNKLEKAKNQNLAKSHEEYQNGNKNAGKILTDEAAKQAKAINEQNKIIAELKKKEEERKKIATDVINDSNKGWWQNVELKSWKVWVGGSLIILIPIFIWTSWSLIKKWFFSLFSNTE